MKDIENILGEEKIIHKLYDDDPVIRYIKSFDNVLYADYSYSGNDSYETYDSLIGLFAYHKDDKYLFGEFGYFKENREELKLIVSDYPEYITLDNYELTNEVFNDLINLHNISMNQFSALMIGKNEIDNIKSNSLKKITLEEYIEIFPHRYINNRIRFSSKDKRYERIYIDDISEDLIYRCSYCGASNLSKIVNNDINNLQDIDIIDYDDDAEKSLYICKVCGLISRSPDNIMDYI